MSNITNHFALHHILPGHHIEPLQMRIHGNDPVAMIQLHHPPIPSPQPSLHHPTPSRSMHRRPIRPTNVHPLMKLPFPIA